MVSDVLAELRRHPAFLLVRASPSKRQLESGVPAVNALLDGGLPRGALTELVGHRSSGRTALALAAGAAAAQRGEVVAWIDPGDSLDPFSARAAGLPLAQLLWVRPRGRDAARQALKAADLVLDARGFGLVVLDLSECVLRTSSASPWLRLSRRLEGTDTALLVLASDAAASASALRLGMRGRMREQWQREAGIESEIEVLRARGHEPGGRVRVLFASVGDE